jgi:hypothetical protein
MKNTQKKLPRGFYWAAVDNRGRQVWGDTVKRKVVRAAKGLFKIVALAKEDGGTR